VSRAEDAFNGGRGGDGGVRLDEGEDGDEEE